MQSNNYELGAREPNEATQLPELGVPAKKSRLWFFDIVVLIVSFGCCATAVIILRHDMIAWLLGYQYQLVVIGLSLSIMSVCLSYSRTYLLILLEARFGRSTLQNYDAILQRTMYGPQTDFHWRVVLLGSWLLPLGLSVAYKLFPVTAVSIVWNYSDPIDFGFFPPLGLEKAGHGVALMANISLPFMQETTAPYDFEADPPEEFSPRTYGLNTLTISHTAVAVLDLPSPNAIANIRNDLWAGETQILRADVMATVTRHNSTVDQYRDDSDQNRNDFWHSYLDDVIEPPAALFHNGWKIWMVNNKKGNDQSWMFLSIQKNDSSFPAFYTNAQMFSTWREPCFGEWNITRTTMQLVEGKCDADRIPENLNSTYLDDFNNDRLALDELYLPTLLEVLGPFTTKRNESEWLLPTMTATVAGMMYSRVTALNGSTDVDFPLRSYPVEGIEVQSTRISLRNSKGLLMVLAVQPVLLIISMAIAWTLYAVPVDRSFGLISILAGIDRPSLQRLSGASLSSKLRKSIRLAVAVDQSDAAQLKICYTIGGQEKERQNSIQKGKVYG